ncbi:hypothetical protein Ddye_007240 [Dipteronia dyeriana]|uniref:Uncharacterized protein n=1 Tax=Dipteronia dyeriana TaxID=168575 RepID=A0AAD9XK72_9ROSI|nr:hypothetical protein Ddye_007240 [Dipteronia dyeriana]
MKLVNSVCQMYVDRSEIQASLEALKLWKETSVKKVLETAKSLGAGGFVLAVESVSPGTKFDPVPVGIPGILITDVIKPMDLIDYYNISTSRDWTGSMKSFKATGSIGDGLMPILHKSAPQVALFSARGPNIKRFQLPRCRSSEARHSGSLCTHLGCLCSKWNG